MAEDITESPMRLVAHGRRSWAEARNLLDGMTCAWADLDGWHEGSAPADAPLATHLWAWSSGRWARVRIDGEDAIVAVLAVDAAVEDGAGDVVAVRRSGVFTWDQGDPQLPAISRDLPRPTEAAILEVVGPLPLTFVDLTR